MLKIRVWGHYSRVVCGECCTWASSTTGTDWTLTGEGLQMAKNKKPACSTMSNQLASDGRNRRNRGGLYSVISKHIFCVYLCMEISLFIIFSLFRHHKRIALSNGKLGANATTLTDLPECLAVLDIGQRKPHGCSHTRYVLETQGIQWTGCCQGH